LVPAYENWAALERVQAVPGLKEELGKVQLACARFSDQCLVTVMRNLGGADRPLLDWAAFSKLVRSVLLPMASVGVVHADIRFDRKTWRFCNILVDEKADQSSELRIIDFESLVVLRGASAAHVLQEYAISVPFFCTESAYTFVLWLVLWVAYVLCPTTTRRNLVPAGVFVAKFSQSAGGRFCEFNDWIGGRLGKLPAYRETTQNSNVIMRTLEVFDRVFNPTIQE
jgi:hypothetical protein